MKKNVIGQTISSCPYDNEIMSLSYGFEININILIFDSDVCE